MLYAQETLSSKRPSEFDIIGNSKVWFQVRGYLSLQLSSYFSAVAKRQILSEINMEIVTDMKN